MKKTILVSVILLGLVSANISAQCYSINKLKYDYRLYVPEYGDIYNPALSGVCSFLIPGLGQMVSGEVGRGLGFMGASAGFGVLYSVGVIQFINSNYYNYDGMYYRNSSNHGSGLMLIGLAGVIAVDVWSIVDAVHVAKVNNMYIRDLRKKSTMSLELKPYVDQISMCDQLVTPVGMTMRVKF